MEHLGFICPPVSSHVTGMTAIARELIGRGHRATMFNIADVRQTTLAEGVEFCPIGIEDHPEGALREYSEAVSRLAGVRALRFGIRAAEREARSLLRDLPGAMHAAEITAIIGDQGAPVCSSVAERLNLPFVSICNAVPANRDPTLPPSFTGWGFGKGRLLQLRNRTANAILDWAVSPILRAVNQHRTQWGLPELHSLDETFSPLGQISQQNDEFDFPNPSRPRHFHYIGVLRRSGFDSVPFPFGQLDGRPVVYASMGTVMGTAPDVYRTLARACDGLAVQLVITLGGAAVTSEHMDLPGDPIVVSSAPQRAVLRRSALTFCHAGLNTVLESLSFGVPVLAMPMVTDQFAVGARLRRCGAGESMTRRQFDSPRLRQTITGLLTDPTYRRCAARMGSAFKDAGGEKRAADIIEEVLRTARRSI